MAKVKSSKWLIVVFVIFAGIWLLTNNVLALSGNGGIISEKLIKFTGNESRLIITAGNDNIVIGMAATPLSIQSSSSSPIMKGQVTTMNGFPTSDVYFQWVDTNGSHVSPTWTIAAPQSFTYDITGLYTGTVTYRLVVQSDGTNYGSWITMKTGTMAADDILWNLIPIIVAGGLLIAAWRLQAPLPLIVIGLITYTIIVLLLRAFVG